MFLQTSAIINDNGNINMIKMAHTLSCIDPRLVINLECSTYSLLLLHSKCLGGKKKNLPRTLYSKMPFKEHWVIYSILFSFMLIKHFTLVILDPEPIQGTLGENTRWIGGQSITRHFAHTFTHSFSPANLQFSAANPTPTCMVLEGRRKQGNPLGNPHGHGVKKKK